jgi:hypothetical protein
VSEPSDADKADQAIESAESTPAVAPTDSAEVPSAMPHVTVKTNFKVKVRKVRPDGTVISTTELDPTASRRLLIMAVAGVALLVIIIVVAIASLTTH